MILFLLVVNGVLLTQLLTTHGLWGKRLNDKDYSTVMSLILYPTVISIVAVAMAFIVSSAYPRNTAGIIGVGIVFLSLVIPLISFAVSVFGTIFIYYGAEDSKAGNRTAKTMTLKDAAKFLQISEDELMGMVQSGKLQARKVDGTYRFDPEILSVIRSMQK
jgi:hypothetical protein